MLSSHTSTWTRVGAWLFKQRTWLPIPLAIILLSVRSGEAASRSLIAVGTLFVMAAEMLRLSAVRQIGVISRTRSDRLGPLMSNGLFGVVRYPLYPGNIGLWVGFAVAARLLWLVPVFLAILGFEYHAIVRWEEDALERRFGDEYRAYAARVPRWIPSFRSERRRVDPARYSWRDTLFSERGTLIAIAVGYLLIWLKSQRPF